MLYQQKSSNIVIGTLIIITLIILLAIGPYFKIVRVATFVLVPLLFYISFMKDLPYITRNKTEFLFLLLIFVSSLTSVYHYINYVDLMRGYSDLLGAIMAAFIPLALNNRNSDYSKYFHVGYIISILVLIFIMYIEKNFELTDFATRKDYRDRFLLNANQYSYLSFFANFSLFYLNQRYKSVFTTTLLISLSIVFLLLNFVTLSRAGLFLIILINFTYWVYVYNLQFNSPLKKILGYVIFLVVFILLSTKFIGIYEKSQIKNRVNEVQYKTDSRQDLIVDGITAFAENPIFGVGLNQVPNYTRYHLMSHNSYIEIFSEQGLFGGIILLLLFGIPLKNCYVLLKKDPKNSFTKINFLFFLTFYLYNNFYTFYKFSFSMLFFFLVVSIQYKIKLKMEQLNAKKDKNREYFINA